MTFELQLRTIQHHMSLTREHIDNLVERFSNRPEPPPFYISEYRQIFLRKNLIATVPAPLLGAASIQKKIFLAFRLPHKKHIKIVF